MIRQPQSDCSTNLFFPFRNQLKPTWNLYQFGFYISSFNQYQTDDQICIGYIASCMVDSTTSGIVLLLRQNQNCQHIQLYSSFQIKRIVLKTAHLNFAKYAIQFAIQFQLTKLTKSSAPQKIAFKLLTEFKEGDAKEATWFFIPMWHFAKAFALWWKTEFKPIN